MFCTAIVVFFIEDFHVVVLYHVAKCCKSVIRCCNKVILCWFSFAEHLVVVFLCVGLCAKVVQCCSVTYCSLSFQQYIFARLS